jgi:Na+-transporting NADH:ubiquinone oxidoreductase subunit D
MTAHPQASLRTLLDPLVRDNPITLQVLGVCSALAVTRSVATALVMSLSVTAVLMVSSVAISTIRNEVPRSVRLIIEITIIASLVIVVDQVLQAFFWELSRELSVFVGLIITNCVILGRAESFAMHQTPGRSLLDALGNGLGYSWILLFIGGIRELLGSGTLLGHVVLPLEENGGWFEPVALMLRPPSAFFLIGLLIWGLRSAHLARARASESASAVPSTPTVAGDFA